MVVFLTLCLGALLSDKEPPQLWAALANCPFLTTTTRRDCVLELFHRHVRSGMRLSEVARLLDHPAWLEEDDVMHFAVSPVELPPGCNPNDFPALDDIPPDKGLYIFRILPELKHEHREIRRVRGVIDLVVSGPPDDKEGPAVAQLLRGTGGDIHKNRVVLEVYCHLDEEIEPEPGATSNPAPAAPRMGR
jgi:hypothetical protein